MNVIIYEPKHNSKRIKIFIPYKMANYRIQIKQLNTSFWHPQQKLWSVVNTKENMDLLLKILGENYLLKPLEKATPIKRRELSPQAKDAILELEKVLTLKRYSYSTIKSYKGQLVTFFSKFMDQNLKQITKEQIESFVFELIQKHKSLLGIVFGDKKDGFFVLIKSIFIGIAIAIAIKINFIRTGKTLF